MTWLKTNQIVIVRWLNAEIGLDRDKSDKSMKFGTQFAYALPNDFRRGAQVNLSACPF